MPIYEYRCNECNHTFEAMQKFSDEPLKTCEKCNGHVTKLISSSAFHLKGSGWVGNESRADKHNLETTKEAKEQAGHSCCGDGCGTCS